MALIVTDRLCLYCGRSDIPKSAEHVLQKSFGTSLVLTEDVCTQCNTVAFSSIDKSFVDFVNVTLTPDAHPHWAYRKNLGVILDHHGRWVTVRMNDKMEASIVPQVILTDKNKLSFVVGQKDEDKNYPDIMRKELKNPTVITFSINTLNPRQDHEPEIQTAIVRTAPLHYQIRSKDRETAESTIKLINEGLFKREIIVGEQKNLGEVPEPLLNGFITLNCRGIERAAVKIILNAICALDSTIARHSVLNPLREYALEGSEEGVVAFVSDDKHQSDFLRPFVNPNFHTVTIHPKAPNGIAIIGLFGRPFCFVTLTEEICAAVGPTLGSRSIIFNHETKESNFFDLINDFGELQSYK